MSETKYQKMGLTPKGNALIAKVQGGSGNIKITKFSAGAGVYEEGEDYTLREGLKDPRQDFAIDSKEVADDNSLILGVTLSNNPAGGSTLQEGYKIREMAFFAQDPDEGEICYSIMVGTDDQMMDYMPAYDGIIPSEIINYFYVKVANADQVTINVAPGDKVGSPEGAYGMRIYNGKQQYLNQEGQWVDIDTDASAMIVNNIENVNEDVPEIEEGDSFGKIIGKLIKLLSNKINISNIVDNCTSDDSDKPLSAKQGKVLMDNKLAKTGDASNTTNIFSQASTRVNLSTGEKISVSLGKIMKWFVDLKEIAFSGKASDLTQDSSNRLVTDTEKSSWNGKVNASNGDIQNTKVGAFTASSASWPIPTAGETVKVILGKIVKYFTDLNNWRSTVVLIANIVNNCTSTDTNKPLSANQGKVLMDGKAPKNHATNSTTYGGGTASNYGHVKLSDSYTSSGGAASNSVGASSKAVADAYAKLNSDINLLKTREYIDYSWNSNTCDAHVYRCGNILQIYLHVTYSPSGLNIGDLPAFTEREIYSVNADKWKPWVDVQKIPLICDSDAYPNCYFSFYADGTIKLGTRETAIPANANKHFYGFVCCIAKT